MFSIKESLKYGWEKFKANKELVLLTTLLVFAVSSVGNIDESMNPGSIFFALAVIIFSIIIRIGYNKIFLRLSDGETPKFTDIFQEYRLFWKYLGTSILTALAVIGGLILLIIPGIFWGIRFSFATLIIVDTQMGPVAAMKESYAITQGKFWKLLGFFLSLVLVNLLGMVALVVGLLVSVPVSMLAMVYVYRELSKAKAAVTVTPTSTPSPQTV